MKCQVRLVIAVSIICTLFYWPCETAANEKTERVVGPIKTYVLSELQQCDANWLQLKFSENCDVEIVAGRAGNAVASFNDLNGIDVTAINQIVSSATVIAPTFHGDRERFREYKLIGESRSGSEGPDLGLWFNLRFASRQELVEKLNQLNAQVQIEIAHPIPEITDASFILPGGTPDFTGDQGYLYDTPFGLDAPAAWALPGGRGANVKFIDVERGWYSNHEDFNQDNFFFNGMSSNPGQTFDHGTAVLGEVVGEDNEFGVIGFASDANWGTVAYPTGAGSNVSASFIEAAEALDPGDVWLIEIQMFPPGLSATPMEYLQANYDAIWTSSFALDVICVEAGANGSQDLDSAAFDGMFDREVRDSGAILVAAGRPNSLIAEGFSNYGSRMDAHAWGSSITTTGYGSLFGFTNTTSYTGTFGGTSGASPMIVGASLCLQGIHKARTGNYLSPVAMRQLISDTGTAHADAFREIGPRPDIAAAIKQLPEACVLGDVNQDNDVNLLDVAPFIAAISSGEFQCEADTNEDGSIDLLDVEGFVEILGGGG